MSKKKVGHGHVTYSGFGVHKTKVEKERARRKRKQDLRKKLKNRDYENV